MNEKNTEKKNKQKIIQIKSKIKNIVISHF